MDLFDLGMAGFHMPDAMDSRGAWDAWCRLALDAILSSGAGRLAGGYGWAVVTPADLRWAVFSASRVA